MPDEGEGARPSTRVGVDSHENVDKVHSKEQIRTKPNMCWMLPCGEIQIMISAFCGIPHNRKLNRNFQTETGASYLTLTRLSH